MPHFIIKAGTYCEGGVCISSRDKNENGTPVLIESKHALNELFPDKFTIAQKGSEVVISPPPKQEESEGIKQFGLDVTSEFAGAEEAGLLILKRSGWHRVFNAQTKEMVHPEAEQRAKAEAVITDLVTAFNEG